MTDTKRCVRVAGWEARRNRLRRFRELREMTGADVARRANGRTPAYVRNVEAGFVALTRHDAMLDMARAYGLPVEVFEGLLAGKVTAHAAFKLVQPADVQAPIAAE